MKVDAIRHYASLFGPKLMDNAYKIDLAKYELLQHWSHKWDIEDLDLATTYDSSLHSTISGHLWGGSTDSAKSEMIRMINEDKEFVRSTLKDLLRDDYDLGLRVDRFLHHLDELYRVIKRKDHKAISHHHDRKMATLLLAAHYPERYCLHDYESFTEMMHRLEARRIPQEAELERYYKSLRGIYKVVTADPMVQQALAVRCATSEFTFIPSLFLMNDYMEFVTREG